MSIIVQTPRLVIREFLAGEQETYLNHFTDEMVTRYLPKRSREERVGIFNKALDQYAVTDILGMWGMFDDANGEFIGSCLLRSFNTEPGIIELGYSMEQKYWGRGLGGEMATAMVAHAFSDPNTVEVVAVTVPENIGSQRVLQKAGLLHQPNIFRDGLELAFFKLER